MTAIPLHSAQAQAAAELELRRRTRLRSIAIPESFVGFCAWLGVTLTPGQEELARVAFDGETPRDPALAARIFGALASYAHRPIVAAVCGARAGKSYVLVALRLLYGMLTRDVSACPPGQRASALVIAPRPDHRAEVMRYALGAVESKPELREMLSGRTTGERFVIRRPDGHKVEFRAGVATVGGTAARGAWWTDVALDECAFFRDSAYKINDEEIFDAAKARVLKGGQVILASTPWAQAGLLYNFWVKRPEDTIVAHAPTLLLNDSDLTRSIVQREEKSDPDNAKREYGAEFMTSGTTVFFEPQAIEGALTDEPFTLAPGDEVAAGVDLAFVGDSSALILAARRGDTIHVFDGREERPSEGRPLDPFTTIKSFVEAMAGRVSYAFADQHYFQALVNECSAHSLTVAPAPPVPADTYVRARVLFRGAKVKIHPLPFRDRLVQQLRDVQGRPTSGGGLSIINPRWAKGGHGDICAALMLALWQTSGDEVEAPKPEPATPAWEEAAREARRAKHLAEQETPWWKKRGRR